MAFYINAHDILVHDKLVRFKIEASQSVCMTLLLYQYFRQQSWSIHCSYCLFLPCSLAAAVPAPSVSLIHLLVMLCSRSELYTWVTCPSSSTFPLWGTFGQEGGELRPLIQGWLQLNTQKCCLGNWSLSHSLRHSFSVLEGLSVKHFCSQ